MKNLLLALTYFSLLLFTEHGSIYAQSKVTTFKAEALQQVPGCPINSECNQLMGQKRTNWLKHLKKYNQNTPRSIKQLESYRSRHGILVDTWLSSVKIENIPLIGWDSFCKNHRQGNKQLFYQGKVFVKNFLNSHFNMPNKSPALKKKTLKITQKNIFLDPLIVKQKGKITTYWVPAKDTPYAIEKNRILVLREEEGEYFTLAISSTGSWKIIKTDPNKLTTSFKTTCPKDLLDHMEKITLPLNLYQVTTCKTIQDLTTKKEAILLSKWSCPS